MNETAYSLSSSRTLWDLVARRADLTPDRPVFLQDDRALTFGELRDRSERVAAYLYGMGVRPGTVVAWQLPTRIETALLSFALARLGAVQTPVIPFYRDREVGFALRESKAEYFAVPGVWRGFDYGEMARRLGARGIFEAYDDAQLPVGDPALLPRPARRRHLRPLDLLDLRHHLRPQRRAAHGPFTDRGRLLPRPRAPPDGGRRGLDGLPLRTHSGGRLHGDAAAVRLPRGDVRAVRAAGRAGGVPQARGDGGKRLDCLLFHVPCRAAQAAGREGHSLATAARGRWRAEAAGGLPLRRTGDGGPAHPRLRHDRGADDHDGAPDDTVENLATTEGRPPDGMEIRIAAGGGRCGCAGRPCVRGTWTRRRRRRRSTGTVSCGPVTSGC